MIAFHGDQTIKTKYIARVRAHRLADELVQGTGWETNGTTRGCAVGCTLDAYDHSRYPVELGIPEWLAHLEDKIFESLPRDEALKWPEKFLKAIHPGADLEPVKHQIAIRRLTDLAEAQEKAIGDQWGAVAALRLTIAYHETPTESARSAAESAAESAARSARSARSTAWSARAAARSAAESAAESAAWEKEATYLIKALRECKP